MNAFGSLPLFWRVIAINGLAFSAGVAALAVSPATVSSRVAWSEVAVLAVGLVSILAMNGMLLRASLAPLDRLSRRMEDVDLLRPGQRVPEAGSGAVADLVRAFNAMLARLEYERGTSAAAALEATEAERRRIAQELHDEIGQSLTVVLLGLKRVVDRAPADLRDDLRMIQDSTRLALEEVRGTARRLRPGVLDDLGLLAALAALASEFSAHTGTPVRRGFGPGLPVLSRTTELVIYRVAQEGLTNAARHSGAGRVDLFLTKHGSAVELRVADDGRGVHGAAEGSGIRGMRERAMLVGADLSIEPGPDGGTQVRLRVPLPGSICTVSR
jgi:two-component system, NarL family, sensor histidine kinase UhpB